MKEYKKIQINDVVSTGKTRPSQRYIRIELPEGRSTMIHTRSLQDMKVVIDNALRLEGVQVFLGALHMGKEEFMWLTIGEGKVTMKAGS